MYILIVDNDDRNRKLFRDILQVSGYETVEAEHGEQCIEIVRQNIPNLILMDIQMPMDGIKTFKILRADPSTKDIPVIAVTAFAMKEDRDRILKEGFDYYVSKPIDVKEFLNIVKSFLDKK